MDPRRVVLATRNLDKVAEIREILKGEPLELLYLADFPGTEQIEENGETFMANARKKAQACFRATGMVSLADDSGLEVDVLGGAPGILSSRFAGEGATYRDNNEKLLHFMKDIPKEKRSARFRCVVVLVDGSEDKWAEGTCEGMILSEYRGDKGFGYDPLFYVPEAKKTFAEMSRDEKNRISHRGKAFRNIAATIRQESFKHIGA